jgi:hypothetical protein
VDVGTSGASDATNAATGLPEVISVPVKSAKNPSVRKIEHLEGPELDDVAVSFEHLGDRGTVWSRTFLSGPRQSQGGFLSLILRNSEGGTGREKR